MTIATEILGTDVLVGAVFVAPPAAPPDALPVSLLADDVYLVEVEAYSGTGGAVTFRPIATLGGDVLAALDPADSPSQALDLYWSDKGYTSGAGDSLPSEHFEARASDPLQVDRAMPLTPETDRRATFQIGTIAIDNADGSQDAIADLAVDARPVHVRYGDKSWPYDDFTTLFSGSGLIWERTANVLRLTLRGRDYLLDVPLQPILYGGTGGADGGADIKGKPLPQLYGVCRDVTPVMVNAALLIYQIHDRAVQSIDAVYDRAQSLDFDADYASYTALAAASMAPGEYATCIAEGLFRLGGDPAGIVTADAHGDAEGAYVSAAPQIARRLMLDRAGLAIADIDADGIAATSIKAPGITGYYFTEPTTIAAALSEVCAGAFLWWGSMRNGDFTVRRLSPPSAPRFVITEDDLVAPLEQVPLPQSVNPCNWRRRVGFRRCWTPQTGTEIDAAFLTADRRNFVSQPYRTAYATDALRRVRNRLATDPAEMPSAFDQENDAQALADNVLSLFTPDRRMFRVPIPSGGHDLDLDQCIRLSNPRYSLSAGRDFRIVAMDERHRDRRIDLMVWG